MKDFQLALFKSGTPHLDLAQDHAFFATMFHYARDHNIKYILNGGNHSTECIRNPLMWLYYGTDMSFNDIRKSFVRVLLKIIHGVEYSIINYTCVISKESKYLDL